MTLGRLVDIIKTRHGVEVDAVECWEGSKRHLLIPGGDSDSRVVGMVLAPERCDPSAPGVCTVRRPATVWHAATVTVCQLAYLASPGCQSVP